MLGAVARSFPNRLWTSDPVLDRRPFVGCPSPIPRSEAWALAFLIIANLTVAGWGQVRIESAGSQEVPREQVDLLFKITCRVVAEEFRLPSASDLQVPVTLVLGDSRQGVIGDETSQLFTIYMARWDETLFATSVSRIALQHLLSQDRKARIVSESLRRVREIAPVSRDVLLSTGKALLATHERNLAIPSPITFEGSLPDACWADRPPAKRADRSMVRRDLPCSQAARFAP